MITPIQCATMHSGLTEQEVKEKYDWVLRALSEYGSRCVYDFLDGNSPEPAKHKPFIVGNVRDILDELKQEEITFNLFVEKLNAIARKFYEGASEKTSDQFIDKHLAKVMGLTIDSYISTHIEKMYGGLEMASVNHFVETGKVNGSFYIRLKEMMMEFAKQWGKTANRLSASPASEGMAEALRLLKEYEQWEADLIADNEMWWPNVPKDRISGKTYDKMLELQEKRNKLLASLSPGVEDGSGAVKGGLKRYLAFYGHEFYPNGGMADLLSDHDTPEEALASIQEKLDKELAESGYDSIDELTQYRWWNIYDTVSECEVPTPPGVEDNQTKKQ